MNSPLVLTLVALGLLAAAVVYALAEDPKQDRQLKQLTRSAARTVFYIVAVAMLILAVGFTLVSSLRVTGVQIDAQTVAVQGLPLPLVGLLLSAAVGIWSCTKMYRSNKAQWAEP